MIIKYYSIKNKKLKDLKIFLILNYQIYFLYEYNFFILFYNYFIKIKIKIIYYANLHI